MTEGKQVVVGGVEWTFRPETRRVWDTWSLTINDKSLEVWRIYKDTPMPPDAGVTYLQEGYKVLLDYETLHVFPLDMPIEEVLSTALLLARLE